MPSLICPVCTSALIQTENLKSFQCEHKHLFDSAKQGYTNLLLSHQKKSKHPGDTSEMVIARKEFLNLSHYEKILNAFTSLVHKHILVKHSPIKHNPAKNCSPEKSFAYTDLGCGEGYYTEHVHQSLAKNHALDNKCIIETCGIDISTPAIKAACKRDKSILWLVASASNAPIASASQDLVSCLFFRFDASEAARILKEDAILISANTGPAHLIELREHLYDEVKIEKSATLEIHEQRLEHIASEHVKHQIELHSQTEIEQLLTMTPHYWRAKPEKKSALTKLEYLKVSLDIRFDVYRRTNIL